MMKTSCTNMLIVDDHCLFSESLSFYLKSNKISQNIEEANSYNSAIECIRTKEFNCALIDINLKNNESSGIELGMKIKSKYPETKIIIMSANIKSFHLEVFQIQNFDGLLSKYDNISQFKLAIHKVLKNQKYCSEVFKKNDHKSDPGLISEKIFQLLTKKEQVVYRMLLTKKSYKEIANLLNIELSTFKKHTSRIYKKMGYNSRIELMNNGLLNE
ncbi:MAG TPA: response regulator transcription factor [Bacteroidia bacterium]